MLNRGLVAGYRLGDFRTGFESRWNLIRSVNDFQKAFCKARCDILLIKANADKGVRRLVSERIQILSEEVGIHIDVDKIQQDQRNAREANYEEFLLKHYNLSREEAAAMMAEAISDESLRHGFKKGKIRRGPVFKKK